MSEPVYPIVTREETEDGFIMRWDYGPKQGVTTGIVHRVRATAEERETVRIVGKADEYLRICLMLGVSLKTFVTVKEVPA